MVYIFLISWKRIKNFGQQNIPKLRLLGFLVFSLAVGSGTLSPLLVAMVMEIILMHSVGIFVPPAGSFDGMWFRDLCRTCSIY